jgi:hypothetical protein
LLSAVLRSKKVRDAAWQMQLQHSTSNTYGALPWLL